MRIRQVKLDSRKVGKRKGEEEKISQIRKILYVVNTQNIC